MTTATAPRKVRWAIQDSWTLMRRDLIRTARQPEIVFFAVIMGVFFLLLFNYVFGAAIGAGTGVDYLDWLLPGILVITVLNGTTTTGSGLALDLSEGVNDRFRSLPMSRVAVIAGRTLADGLRNAVGVVLVAVVGIAIGFRFDSFLGAIAALALVVVFGFAFSWVNAAIAAKVRNAEMVGMLAMFWLFPLMFASTLFTPSDGMPGWLKGFAENQPMSVVADAARGLSLGGPVAGPVVQSLLWTTGLLLVFVPLATRLYKAP